ncbi:MAG TPA: tRNA epoxyqueuosine(34) reductase QueG [Candidatus Binatia bacterium]|jgi:epoxyqueuosine reductase|nr:tRNA epoxyqueuosine(34) reductase QueG [Candidatus Binatia bacterium]
MKEAIRERARELGFEDCRFTTAEPPESAAKFQRWLAEGQHGAMGYLERNAHKRIQPQQVLPGARSVISLAVSYGSPRSTVQSPELVISNQWSAVLGKDRLQAATNDGRRTTDSTSGVVARYARYRDYHHVLAERLRTLTEFLDHQGGCCGTRSLWYVDTGPLLERDLAQRAGLGFIGKHTNLISRRLGNWLFLAEIITTLRLEPDAPEKNRCGSCSRCLAACPTQAIKAPFQLDARLCISYLTIELKGSIPVELRPLIGNRIYGCDDCLEVCPWNRFAREGQLMKPHARPDLTTPDLLELLAMDEAEFKSRFAGTPMLRTQRRGLLRNVCVALGNAGNETALPALERAATEPEPLIAEHAHWAIKQIQRRTRGDSER